MEETKDLKMIVEKDLLDQFKNFKIDYSNGWFAKGFKIIAGVGGSDC
ncbi:MAG: hypothetical protein N4A64_02750 [Marinisporobacter sp.]|nr:hypothetical protein [Marinisporobacter sp.]